MIPRAKHQHGPAGGNPGAAERGESSGNREHQLLDYLDGRVCLIHILKIQYNINLLMHFFFISPEPKRCSPTGSRRMAGQPKSFRPAEGHQSAVLHSSAKGKFVAYCFLYFTLFFSSLLYSFDCPSLHRHLCRLLSLSLFSYVFSLENVESGLPDNQQEKSDQPDAM